MREQLRKALLDGCVVQSKRRKETKWKYVSETGRMMYSYGSSDWNLHEMPKTLDDFMGHGETGEGWDILAPFSPECPPELVDIRNPPMPRTQAGEVAERMKEASDNFHNREKEKMKKRERLDVMLDIESLSTAHNGATIQIAAVPFYIEETSNDARQFGSFNRLISPASCVAAGLDVDADTMKWWFSQEAVVQNHVLGEAIRKGDFLEGVLAGLSIFLKELEQHAEKVFIWGYPATSDMTWLQQAYLAAKLPYPVAYNRTRCLGTIADLYWEMYGEKLSDTPKTKINHDALVDCQSQIEMVRYAYIRAKNAVEH